MVALINSDLFDEYLPPWPTPIANQNEFCLLPINRQSFLISILNELLYYSFRPISEFATNKLSYVTCTFLMSFLSHLPWPFRTWLKMTLQMSLSVLPLIKTHPSITYPVLVLTSIRTNPSNSVYSVSPFLWLQYELCVLHSPSLLS